MRTIALIGAALLLGACNTSLLGGECAPGYVEVDRACVVVNARASSSGAGGSPCAGDLAMCGGACVDLLTDPGHCGGCANACASTACVDGMCQPPADVIVGHAIVVGMDFGEVHPSDPMAHLLGNAVFTATHAPVRVLDYREHAEWNASAVTNTVDLIADEAIARGRTVQTVVAANGAEVPDLLGSDGYDVLFVHDLSAAPQGTLAPLGTSWAGALDHFVEGGGVVVIVATATGSGQMSDFIASSGLALTKGTASAAGEALLVAGTDSLGAGLGTSLPAANGATSFLLGSGGPAIASVVTTAANAPVVLHRTWIAQ